MRAERDMGWVNWCDTPLADTISRALSPGTQSFGFCEDLSGVFWLCEDLSGRSQNIPLVAQPRCVLEWGILREQAQPPISHILLHTIKA